MTTKRSLPQVQNVEFISLTQELMRFRQQLEIEAGEPLCGLEVDAALLLSDLCNFLKLGPTQKALILGEQGTAYLVAVLQAKVSTLPRQ